MTFERVWHKQYPANIPPELNFEKLTMPEFLTRSAERFPDQAALDYMGRKITYPQLDALVNRFARALTDLGVKKGDAVAMLLPNIPQIVIATYAAWRIGAVVAMNNPLYTERELAHQLNLSDARVLVTLDMLHPRALNLIETTPVETVIVCHINDYLAFPKKQLFPFVKKEMYRRIDPRPDTFEFTALVANQDEGPLECLAELEAVGAHMYTGGTTGVSKGAMITHKNMSYNTQQLRHWIHDLEDGKESELAVFPFFHCAGFTGVQNVCILAGWTDVLVPRPDPAVIVDILKKSRPTVVPGVPTIYVGLLANEDFRTLDLSFIKCFIAGGRAAAHGCHQPAERPDRCLHRQCLRADRNYPHGDGVPLERAGQTRHRGRAPAQYRSENSGSGNRGDRNGRRRTGGGLFQGPPGHGRLSQAA